MKYNLEIFFHLAVMFNKAYIDLQVRHLVVQQDKQFLVLTTFTAKHAGPSHPIDIKYSRPLKRQFHYYLLPHNVGSATILSSGKDWREDATV
jgi:hypothetical protein